MVDKMVTTLLPVTTTALVSVIKEVIVVSCSEATIVDGRVEEDPRTLSDELVVAITVVVAVDSCVTVTTLVMTIVSRLRLETVTVSRLVKVLLTVSVSKLVTVARLVSVSRLVTVARLVRVSKLVNVLFTVSV